MWIKVFVKALPNTVTSLINSCLAVSLHDNICISNAQYSSLSAQQNLWCEILKFWRDCDKWLTHSVLCDFCLSCARIWRCKRGCLRLLKSLFCAPIEPLLSCSIATIVFPYSRFSTRKVIIVWVRVGVTAKKTLKTAKSKSIYRFYFVTAFYSLYDIFIVW